MRAALPDDLLHDERAASSSPLDAELTIRLRQGANGGVRADGVLCSAPVWFRWDGATLWLVGSGAAPVGEDHIRVRVDVGEGVEASVRSVAATVIYAARGEGTRWDTEIHVADGGRLRWWPEPVILTERARHAARTTVHAAAGAQVLLDEVLVLGREGETAGAMRSTLDVRVAGTPTLLTSTDTTIPGWAGPAGIAGAHVVHNRLHLGPDAVADRAPSDAAPRPHGVLLSPAPQCLLAVAAAGDVAAAKRTVDALLT